MKGRIVRRMEPMVSSELERDSGLVHANSFSNENGAVLLRFQKDLRPHLSFSYRFAPPHYNAASVLKMLLYSAHAQINSTHAHFNTSTREVGGKLKPHGSVCLQFGSKTSPFSFEPFSFENGLVWTGPQVTNSSKHCHACMIKVRRLENIAICS